MSILHVVQCTGMSFLLCDEIRVWNIIVLQCMMTFITCTIDIHVWVVELDIHNWVHVHVQLCSHRAVCKPKNINPCVYRFPGLAVVGLWLPTSVCLFRRDFPTVVSVILIIVCV